MGFSEGFRSGFGVVNQAYNDRYMRERTERLDAENLRRQSRVERLQDDELRRVAEEREGTQLFNRFQNVSKQMQDDKREWGEVINDPRYTETIADIMNSKYFKDDIGPGKRFHSFQPDAEGNLVALLEVDDPKAKGGKRIAPMTRNRSTAPDDPVTVFTPEQVMDFVGNRLGQYGQTVDPRSLRNQDAAVASDMQALYQGGQAPQPAGLRAGSGARTGMANERFALNTVDAATVPRSPYGTGAPQTIAEGDPELTPERQAELHKFLDASVEANRAPPAAPSAQPAAPSAQPAAPKTLAQQQAERDAQPSLFDKGLDYLFGSGAKERGLQRRKQTIDAALQVTDPGTFGSSLPSGGDEVRRNPEKWLGSYTAVRHMYSAEDQARLDELFRGAADKKKEELKALRAERSERAGVTFSPWEAGRTDRVADAMDRTQAEIDEIEAALAAPPAAPGTVVEEKPVRPAQVSTPARVEKQAAAQETQPLPNRQRAVADTSLVLSRSTGNRPSEQQLKAAVRLKRLGYMTAEQVANYATTGKLAKDDWTFIANANVGLRYNKADGSHQILWDRGDPETTRAGREAYIKQQQQGYKDLTAAVTDAIGTGKNRRRGNLADFNRRFGEAITGMVARGIPYDMAAFANNPALIGVVAGSYVDSLAMDKPEGWFRQAVETSLMQARDSRYGKQVPQRGAMHRGPDGVTYDLRKIQAQLPEGATLDDAAEALERELSGS